MKITLNIPDKFIKSVIIRLISGVEYDSYSTYNEESFNHEPMSKQEKIVLLHNIKDLLPDIAKNAANDEMTTIFETVAELSKETDKMLEKVRNKEEK